MASTSSSVDAPFGLTFDDWAKFSEEQRADMLFYLSVLTNENDEEDIVDEGVVGDAPVDKGEHPQEDAIIRKQCEQHQVQLSLAGVAAMRKVIMDYDKNRKLRLLSTYAEALPTVSTLFINLDRAKAATVFRKMVKAVPIELDRAPLEPEHVHVTKGYYSTCHRRQVMYK